MAYPSPRLTRLFAQLQTTYTAFNNAAGTWTNTGAQIIRIDQGTLDIRRNAPYSRFPVVTGSRSELAGIRGRKNASISIRGVPFIPNGVAATVPDTDLFLQSAFGVAATSGVYTFADTTFPLISLFKYIHGVSGATNLATWGCVVTRITWHFNGLFLTMDVDLMGGYAIDSTGFSVFDSQAAAGLTSFPAEPVSGLTVNGNPIAGFGNGYALTLHSNTFNLTTRVLSLTLETGNELVQDVYGSAYPVQPVGNARRVSLACSMTDDESTAVHDIMTQSDTDMTAASVISGSIVAGNVAGSKFTWALNNIEPNAFNLRDEGAIIMVEIPTSYAHATSIGTSDDMTLTCG